MKDSQSQKVQAFYSSSPSPSENFILCWLPCFGPYGKLESLNLSFLDGWRTKIQELGPQSHSAQGVEALIRSLNPQ